jgi:hypothetical protein
MFEKIKFSLAHYIIRKKYMVIKNVPVTFNGILSNSSTFFIIMPNDPVEFSKSSVLINFLLENCKVVTVLLHESKSNLISEKENVSIIKFMDETKSRLNLPVKPFVKMLQNKEFDVVMDLNRSSDVFLTAVANIVKASVKVGFEQPKTEDYYDIRIVNSNQDYDLIYTNYINFLKMF